MKLKESICIFSFVLLLFSCTEDKLSVGIELLPAEEEISALSDTLSVGLYTGKGISNVVGSNSESKDYLANEYTDVFSIGAVFDPVFGQTTVSAVFEFIYSSELVSRYSSDGSKIEIPQSFRLLFTVSEAIDYKDSIEFIDLQPYGNPNSIDFDVFALTDTFKFGALSSSNLASEYFDFKNIAAKTSYTSDISSYGYPNYISAEADYIIVDLDTSLVRNFFDASIYGIYDFKASFPGLYIIPRMSSGTDGAIQPFSPKLSGLMVEYNRIGGAVDGSDTTIFMNYPISKHQYFYQNVYTNQGAEIEQVIGDTMTQADNVYLQGLTGTSGVLKLSSLKSYKDMYKDAIGINYAEIVLPINKAYLNDTTQFALPKRLTFSVLGSSNERIRLADDEIGAYYLNGYLDKKNWEYRINFSEFVHRYMSDIYDYSEVQIEVADFNTYENSTLNITKPARVVLFSGNDHLVEKSYLRIIYTLLNN